MSHRILLAESNFTEPAVAEADLVAAGYRVAAVTTFEQAARQIAVDCPDLIVAAIRLNQFNGVHLLLRVRTEHQDVPVIMTGDPADNTPEIGRYGGHFLATPLDPGLLLETVSQLLDGRTPHDPRNERRWRRKAAALDATVHKAPARVVELSYGGLRLEMRRSPGDERRPLHIQFPSLGVSIIAVPRWFKPLEDGHAWWCGVEVAVPRNDDAHVWRSIVDSFN